MEYKPNLWSLKIRLAGETARFNRALTATEKAKRLENLATIKDAIFKLETEGSAK